MTGQTPLMFRVSLLLISLSATTAWAAADDSCRVSSMDSVQRTDILETCVDGCDIERDVFEISLGNCEGACTSQHIPPVIPTIPVGPHCLEAGAGCSPAPAQTTGSVPQFLVLVELINLTASLRPNYAWQRTLAPLRIEGVVQNRSVEPPTPPPRS